VDKRDLKQQAILHKILALKKGRGGAMNHISNNLLKGPTQQYMAIQSHIARGKGKHSSYYQIALVRILIPNPASMIMKARSMPKFFFLIQ
jgi:hypothetical protein